MLYTLLAIYAGIGFLCTVLLIAVCVRKGQTDHLARPPKAPTNITIVTSPLHRNITSLSPTNQLDEPEANTSQAAAESTEVVQHRSYTSEAPENVDDEAQEPPAVNHRSQQES